MCQPAPGGTYTEQAGQPRSSGAPGPGLFGERTDKGETVLTQPAE